MKRFNHSLEFLFILFALQLACGQTKSNEKRNIDVAGENKEANTKVETDKLESDSKTIKSAFPSLMQQAEIMRKAYLAEDFDKYADFMFPYLVEVQGGKRKFISNLNSTISNLRTNGVRFVTFEIKDPIQSIETEDTLFVVLPMETKMKSPEKTTTEEGNILAVSGDNGKNWKFIRATSKEKLRFLFPQIVNKLNFAASKFSESKT